MAELAEPVMLAKDGQLLVACWRSSCEADKCIRLNAKLLRQEGERGSRDHLSALDETAGITECAKLKGQAKTGIVAPACFEKTMVLIVEAPMADQGVVVGGQGKEILPFGIRGALWSFLH